MKIKIKVVVIGIILIILLLAWAPWITDEYVVIKIKENKNFISQHAPYEEIGETIEINVIWLPFGRGVITGEGLWYVTFFGFVI